jgi:hypothetical protein
LAQSGGATFSGKVKSESGGFEFPDGSVQTTATPEDLVTRVSQLESMVGQQRSVYLTSTYHSGADVANACAEGYHFASITELLGSYNMVYNPTLGTYYEYQAFGMLQGGEAWVKTARAETSCVDWTSSDPNENGAVTSLIDLTDDGLHNPQWYDFEASCDSEWRVYCVSDPVSFP